MIDVSQSVEHSHPNALEFLRIDINNVTIFFKAKKVPVMRNKELFDFVTDGSLKDEDVRTVQHTHSRAHTHTYTHTHSLSLLFKCLWFFLPGLRN